MSFITWAFFFLLRFLIIFIGICVLEGGFGIALLPACIIATAIMCLIPGVWGKKRSPPA